MARQTVKLLLVDPDGRLLLVHGRDPATGTSHWYPVGGGVERGESLNQAASREAWEETGLDWLPVGVRVWTRDATYTHAGRTFDVHEDWLHHPVAHFDPAPARLTDHESESILGFQWWTAEELRTTTERVFPPDLGSHLGRLQECGCPEVPIDIGAERSADRYQAFAARGAVPPVRTPEGDRSCRVEGGYARPDLPLSSATAMRLAAGRRRADERSHRLRSDAGPTPAR
jgi:8-oxo-dGTP pyrophosphatase MutT (NUDIX family)